MTTKPTARKFRIRMPGEGSAAQPTAPEPPTTAPSPDGFGDKPFPGAAAAKPGPHIPTVTVAPASGDRPTSRQMRLARRLALKHDVAGEDDAALVKGLRDKGVDPFDRAGLIGIARAEDAKPKEAATAPATVTQIRPAAPEPAKPAAPAAERAREILEIQRDIARRRRRKITMLTVRLLAFVAAPTAFAAYYFFFLASPMYATHSEFVIQQADQQGGGMSGLLSGTGLATSQDSITVQSYLQSRESMLRLDQDIGFKAHFSDPAIDPLQRLDPDASNEAAYRHYKKKVKIGFDPTEGIVKMEVIAADPAVSAAFSRALIAYAEEQVDTLSLRLREDQMRGAQDSFREAEARMEASQDRVIELQEQLGVLDPASESSVLMNQIAGFETQVAEKRLQLDQLLDNPAPNAARVAGVEGDILRLQALIREMRAELTEGTGSTGSLARISAELQMAQVDLETRTMMMQEALQHLEAARIEANRQVRYLSTGVNPIPPDEASYPRAWENTLLTFFVFAGIYLMLSLTASILREQVSG